MSNDHSLQNLWSINNVKKYTIKTNQKRSANSFLYIEWRQHNDNGIFCFSLDQKQKIKNF